MSNGGGAGGGGSFGGVQSAADAPDPNDAIAKLKAAPTQAAATLLKVMTLPLSAPVARSACPDLVRRHAKSSFRAACVARNHSRTDHRHCRRWIDAIVPRLHLHLSQATCQPLHVRCGCRKSVTSSTKSGEFHPVTRRRKFGHRESHDRYNSRCSSDLKQPHKDLSSCCKSFGHGRKAGKRRDHRRRGGHGAEDAALRLDHLQAHVVEFRKI